MSVAIANDDPKASPCLPLDIFEEIACFLAGENHFGTLAALCATSKLIARELKGVMYETIVCNDALADRLKASKADEEGCEESRHIK
jgi:hypothetical protein